MDRRTISVMNFADTSNKTLNIKNKIMKVEITKKKTMKRIKKMAVVFRKALPRKKEKPQLVWNGTRTDLMEMVYGMYLSEKVVTIDGRRATLYEITEMTFEAFGMVPPKNPSRMLTTLRERNNPRELSIIYKALCGVYPGFFKCNK